MTIAIRFPDLAHWKAQVKCQAGCPVSTDAGRYVQLIAEGRDEDAFLVARAPNPFASVCGRVCAAPCEDACRRGSIDSPISIRALKRFVTEQYGVESIRPDTQARLLDCAIHEGNVYTGHLPVAPFRREPRRRKVAVIGAGPAGLAAAHDLALLGFAVTVFEASSEAGGMMRWGIPEYRLPRSVIHAEVDKILALGVELRLNTPLSPSLGLAELRADGYEAFFLSVGVSKGRDIQIPGADLDGVIKAVDYLLNVNRGYRTSLGRRVVVIGGGFVAFDAARLALRVSREQEIDTLAQTAGDGDTRVKEALDSARAALRAGAAEVTIVSLETFEEMPVLRTRQGQEEFEEARKEGVVFLTRRGPMRFTGAGRLEAVELRRALAVFDETGRFAPTYDDSDLISLPADGCVLAIGQRADLNFLKPSDAIELTPAGTIRVDRETLATSARGVFAGGDVAFGPRNLIEAIANGKLAARSIYEYLRGATETQIEATLVPEPLATSAAGRAGIERSVEIEQLLTRDYRMIAGFEIPDRETPPTLDLGRRTGIAEVETGYDAEAARRQAARCLVCHVQTIYDPEKCVLCNRCVDVCPEYCLAIVPFEDLDLEDADRELLERRAGANGLPLAAMIKDDERCIRCGLCAIRCPTEAMTMERFTITERYQTLAQPAQSTGPIARAEGRGPWAEGLGRGPGATGAIDG